MLAGWVLDSTEWNMNQRELLQDLFQSALKAVGGRPAVRYALEREPLAAHLHPAGSPGSPGSPSSTSSTVSSASPGPVAVLALGKAADSMLLGAMDVLGEQLHSALLISKHGHISGTCRQDGRITCLEASHPVPDERSLEAGRQMLAFVSALPAGQPLLVLISGGASSLVEVLPEGYGAQHLAELNQWLLGRHLDIARINAVRRAVSCIKGGRLARYLGRRPTRLLLISDVPGDDPAVIGSGLLVPSQPGTALPEGLPDWVRSAADKVVTAPAADDPLFASISPRIIASNAQARAAVARRAAFHGVALVDHGEPLAGDALDAAEAIARSLINGPPGLQLWGGETTVALPHRPGRGGRAQALALGAAMGLEGRPGLALLAAGTDGTDGPGEDAGALVDGNTCYRGRQAGLDPDTCLEQADSGRFLDASGDLVRTGPTGTNVMDLVIGLKA